VVGCDDQPGAGDGQTGREGMAERPVVSDEAGVMLVEGRGLGSRQTLKVERERRLGNLAACRTCVTNASESLRCFTKDGSRSPEVGLQELTSNHPVLLRTKGAVVSDCGKGIVKDVR